MKRKILLLILIISSCNLNENNSKYNELYLRENTAYGYINIISKNEIDESTLTQCGVNLVSSFKSNGDYYLYVKTNSASVSKTIEKLKQKTKAFIIEPDFKAKPLGTYTDGLNDPLIKGAQYSFYTTELNKALKDYGVGTNKVTVVIVDTGINPLHEDLENVDISGWTPFSRLEKDYTSSPSINEINDEKNWDENIGEGHGTYVAGILCAQGNNGKGVTGVIPSNVKLVVFKVFANSPNGMTVEESGSNNAIYGPLQDKVVGDDIDNPAWKKWNEINQECLPINMSYGKYNATDYESYVIQNLYAAGALLIAASGNDGYEVYNFPAAFSCVMSIGSVDGNDNYSIFSTTSPNLSLAAPGSKIISLVGNKNNAYSVNDGTSGAAPFVTGVAGLVLTHNKNFNNRQLRELLEKSCDDVDSENYDDRTGHGRINVLKALGNKDNNNNFNLYTDKKIIIKVNSETLVSLFDENKKIITQSMSYKNDNNVLFDVVFSGLKVANYFVSINKENLQSNIFREANLTNDSDVIITFD